MANDRENAWIIVGGIAIFVSYAAGVLISSAGINVFWFPPDFENSAKFGDSFGPLSAGMATLAAVSALMAYRSQRRELEILREDRVVEGQRAEKRDFEATFFNLLANLRNAVNDVSVVKASDPFGKSDGRDGFSTIISNIYRSNPHDIEEEYKKNYFRNRDDLGHYFRLFYHILKYIDNSNVTDKAFYARILRANLSESEITIIGMNGCYGGGQRKLKPLIEKYSMLHNISGISAVRWGLLNKYDRSAFGDRSVVHNVEDGTEQLLDD